MQSLPYTTDAYELLQEGAIALAEVESNGMCVDTGYLERAIERTERRVKRMQERLEASEVMVEWRKAYGRKANLDSAEQLGKVLFERLGFKPPKHTASGKYSTDEEALSSVDHPFVQDFLEIKKITKAMNTNLRGILREVVDGKIHCFFNLHTVQTYRSSSQDFNFQNLPIRDEEIGRLIRSAFVARPGRQLAEVDFKGAEVCVSACYNKDPRLIDYILDESKDMHRDMAAQLYKLPEGEITKPIRHCGKNMFVFPEFYGDWYKDCARQLWVAADEPTMVTKGGVRLRDHLTKVGFTERGELDPKEKPVRGTFEAHVQEVENDFWNNRFGVYGKWKRTWYDEYRARGWFLTHTGFICQGFMGRNEVINYPVQGSAFHCLLWVLIRLIRRELRRRKMQSLIVGQIHDSMVCDVVESERDEFLALCNKVITEDLPRHWDWLIVPMKVEAEVAPVGGTWADKKGYAIPA